MECATAAAALSPHTSAELAAQAAAAATEGTVLVLLRVLGRSVGMHDPGSIADSSSAEVAGLRGTLTALAAALRPCLAAHGAPPDMTCGQGYQLQH